MGDCRRRSPASGAARLPAQSDAAGCAAGAAVIAGQIQQAYLKNSIATAAATAADLIRQNAVLNAIDDTSKIVGQKVNDPAAMVLAVGRAQPWPSRTRPGSTTEGGRAGRCRCSATWSRR